MSTVSNGDGNYACVLLRNLFTRLLKCYTEQGRKKSCWIAGRCDLRFLNKKKFVCIPSYFEGDIWGCHTQTSFKVNFHLLYVDMQDSTAYSRDPFNTDKQKSGDIVLLLKSFCKSKSTSKRC